jgi:hypothetical protein
MPAARPGMPGVIRMHLLLVRSLGEGGRPGPNAEAIVTRQGGDVPPARGKRGTAPRAQRVERGPDPGEAGGGSRPKS